MSQAPRCCRDLSAKMAERMSLSLVVVVVVVKEAGSGMMRRPARRAERGGCKVWCRLAGARGAVSAFHVGP